MQEELLRDYILSQPDMRLCGAYCDNGRTGTNFDRPGVQEGLSLVEQGLVGTWIVKDMSRFGRDYL